MIKNYISYFLHFFSPYNQANQTLSLWKTLWVNFHLFGISGLRILPIYIFRNTKIYSLGTIKIHGPLSRGLIKIGELDYKSQGFTKIKNNGIIRVNGKVIINGCSIIENEGEIVFRGDNVIADGCNIFIHEYLEMGLSTRIGFHSTVMDTDDHFVVDFEAKKISKNTKPIILGPKCWIGGHTFIKKGTKTPEGMIVASAFSLLTKDYTDCPAYSVYGGNPIRLLKNNVRRIFNKSTERELINHFKNCNDSFIGVDNPHLDKFQ